MAQVDERFFNVDRHGSLRAPGVLWLALAFLARYLILAVVVFATIKRSPEVVRLLGHNYSWYLLPLELPVIALMLAGANRTAAAGKTWRWLWRNARMVIVAMAAMHVVWAGWMLASSDVWRTWPELFLASCALLDVAIAWGISRDDYYRQLFADFPAHQPGATSK